MRTVEATINIVLHLPDRSLHADFNSIMDAFFFKRSVDSTVRERSNLLDSSRKLLDPGTR